MRDRWFVLMSTLLIAASLAVVAGCSGDEPTATGTTTDVATTSLVPTFAQVSGAVPLDAADAGVVKGALNRWQENAGPGEPGSGPGCDRAHPMADFVADVAPALDGEQLGKLVGFLARYRETHMSMNRVSMNRAGDGTGMQHRSGGALHERLGRELGLTPDQIRAMDRLRDQTRLRIRELRQQLAAGTITEDEFAAQREEVRAQHREQVRAILTPEQFAKLEQLQAQRRAQMWTRRAECMDAVMARRAEWMIGALALSDEQAAQVRTTLAACGDDMQALFEAAARGDIDRDQLRTQLHDRRQDCDAALQGILTAEQWERLASMRRLHFYFAAGPHGPGGPDDL